MDMGGLLIEIINHLNQNSFIFKQLKFCKVKSNIFIDAWTQANWNPRQITFQWQGSENQ